MPSATNSQANSEQGDAIVHDKYPESNFRISAMWRALRSKPCAAFATTRSGLIDFGIGM